ncbi:MAG: DUF4159 domain-containing protein [Hyphomicrobium sp.]
MSFAGLIFLNPWLLTALGALPAIYWLLRTVPPTPHQISFPPTRLLIGLENRDKTPSKTPWWLILIRLLAAALVIIGFSEPVFRPQNETIFKGEGPVIILVDNSWTASTFWPDCIALINRLIDKAETENRSIAILNTTQISKTSILKIGTAIDARREVSTLYPQPYPADRLEALQTLKKGLEQTNTNAPTIIWLRDGLEHDGKSEEFTNALREISKGGELGIVDVASGKEPLGIASFIGADGKIVSKVLSTGAGLREGKIAAYSSKNQRLAEAPFKIASGENVVTADISLPLELRNQVSRVEIDKIRSAGAVSLLDQRSQWQRVGLISGEQQEKTQPLLGPIYYIQRALKPFCELIIPNEKNVDSGLSQIINDKANIIMLADIGTIAGEAEKKLKEWIKKGGILVRFSGPKLEKGGDELLPVGLRAGGRSLGGTMSWSTPQPLGPFEETSIFSGLVIPEDVLIRKQVLADPAQINPEVKIWARLKDGTPIVTSSEYGDGKIVLFHITANSEWSNLPMSGLFVEMLRRMIELGSPVNMSAISMETQKITGNIESKTSQVQKENLPPLSILDGFGTFKTPPPTALPIQASEINKAKPSLEHPPGYYGKTSSPYALNVLSQNSVLKALPSPPRDILHLSYESENSSIFIKAWALLASLCFLLIDMLAILFLMGVFKNPKSKVVLNTFIYFFLSCVLFLETTGARGQDTINEKSPNMGLEQNNSFDVQNKISTFNARDAIAMNATSKVTLGYILTGNPNVDATSLQGLSGLARVLQSRTAVDPGEPKGIDIINDEIAFYPVLYWPVLDAAEALPEVTLAKIDAYMKQGGMIIFDTRDYGSGLPTGMVMAGENGPLLQRMIGKLDVPRLEPVPENHVLKKSFYILNSFPGRWEGGDLWVEAQDDIRDVPSTLETKTAKKADGVTSILVSSNDFASAWALDERGRPLYPVVPGGEEQREIAFRAGINIVMHALTGNYKADQVHVPALLERLGQ